MIKIAVCDDDRSFISTLWKEIKEYAPLTDLYEFYAYSSGEALLADAARMHDLVFLDMILSEDDEASVRMDGQKTAEKLRSINPSGILVFCTSMKNPTAGMFKVKASRFFHKGLEDDELRGELWEVLAALLRQSPIIMLRDGHRMVQVNLSKALYFVIDQRKVKLVSESDWDIVTESLTEIYEKVGSIHQFAFCNVSYLVNLRQIRKKTKTSVVMKNMDEIMISRSRSKEFEEAFRAHLVSEGDRMWI